MFKKCHRVKRDMEDLRVMMEEVADCTLGGGGGAGSRQQTLGQSGSKSVEKGEEIEKYWMKINMKSRRKKGRQM